MAGSHSRTLVCFTLHFFIQVIMVTPEYYEECEKVMDPTAAMEVRRAKQLSLQLGNTNKTLEQLSPCLDDMLLSPLQAQAIYNSSRLRHLRSKRSIYNFDKFPSIQWTLPIGYKISDDFGGEDKKIIRQAFQAWERNTCVTFEEQAVSATGTPYLNVVKGTGCISFVGKAEKQPQPIYLAGICLQKMHVIAHEIGHALGLWHTHQRADRDDHVTVVRGNIQDSEWDNFFTLPPSWLMEQENDYDFASNMHYYPRAFSKNGQTTLVTRDPLFQYTIGQRVELSFQDVKAVNQAYCKKTCGNPATGPPCQHGGYQDPKSCDRCLCADGWKGPLCGVLADSKGDSCGGDMVANGRPQYITSPLFDRLPYQEGQECVWRIKSADASPVKMRFVGNFRVYCEGTICNHWVEIRYRQRDTVLGPRFCCYTRPAVQMTAETEEVLVIFRAPATRSRATYRAGFKLEFTSDADVVTTPPDRCISSPCKNGGKCQQTGSTICTCPTGFSGIYCQSAPPTRCASRPCMNGGTCLPSGPRTCRCPPGYLGAVCQSAPPNRCASQPCQNGGQCQASGSAVCSCRPGFMGLYCQTDTTPCGSRPCRNGGVCSSNQTSFTCSCRPGYTGATCQTDIDECSSAPCRNGGTCSDLTNGYVCRCGIGFTGTTCQTEGGEQCTPNPCRNGGTCLVQAGTFSCLCPSSLGGKHCDQGSCGACGLGAGSEQRPCSRQVSYVTSQQTCSRWSSVQTTTRFLIFWTRRVTRRRLTYYRCQKSVPQKESSFCCDNANLMINGNTKKCVVGGWTSFSSCDGRCGGCGRSRRAYYQRRLNTDSRGQRRDTFGMWQRWCGKCGTPCCRGFRRNGQLCV